MSKKKVAQLIPNVVEVFIYVDYLETYLDFVFTKKTLKNHLHVIILKKLKTRNSNEEELETAKNLCDTLECLKAINGQK
jgi:hypothetical protein